MPNHAYNVLYTLYRDVVEENQELRAQNARRECGCSYCRQKTEWGICDANGVARKPHDIFFCPWCGKSLA